MSEQFLHTHKARKRFGQNFLRDQNIIDRIVKSIAPNQDFPLIEIGPGLGALTESLLAIHTRFAAIEIDRDLAAQLRERFPQLLLIEADALKVNINDIIKQLGQNAAVGKANIVGNLPYNISTPLIFGLLESRNHINAMYFMLQKEVVDRMAASPGNKEYGRLSVMVQYHCDVSPLFDISPQCFNPAPKVESTFVLLKPRPFPLLAASPLHLEKLVNHAFQQRRKTLRNAIRSLLPAEIPVLVQTKLSQRAEEISVADYVQMSNALCGGTAK